MLVGYIITDNIMAKYGPEHKKEWAPVSGYEGIYEVSRCGLVRGVDRYILKNKPNEKGTHHYYKGRLKKAYINNRGYYALGLYHDGKQKNVMLHRIIALAFIPKVAGKDCINHINGRKTDNRIENLEWCTISENTKHALEMGLSKPKTAEHMKKMSRIQVKLRSKPVAMFDMLGNFIAEFSSGAEARRQTGLDPWYHRVARAKTKEKVVFKFI